MEIGPIGQGAAPGGEARRKVKARSSGEEAHAPADTVALSEDAKALLASKSAERVGVLTVREERIEEARRRIARGDYKAAPVKGIVLAKLVESLLNGLA